MNHLFKSKYFTVRPAGAEDIPHVAANLRDGDRLELERFFDASPEEVLAESVQKAHLCWTAAAPDGEPVAIWGVNGHPAVAGYGIPWLLGTPRIRESVVDFLSLSRRYFAIMSEPFDFLLNYVDADYDEALRWLMWLGFTPSGVSKSPKGFPFVLMGKVVL